MTKKYGNQEPRIKLVPDYFMTDGEDAAELVKAYGYDLDPWQREICKSWFGRDEFYNYSATSCGLSVPRQNGKNALLEVRELYGLAVLHEKILHTAHEVKTARQAFLRLCSFFENENMYPELAELVKEIRRTNGQECISLTNGGIVYFSSRSSGANRGFTVDVVVYDEAQALTDEQQNALLPTLSASPSGKRQFIFTGTPPTPKDIGEVFRRVRQSAINKTDDKLAWHEWSIEKLPDKGTSIDELVDLAFETNPAMGYRLTPEFTKKEAIQMSLDGYARERLGWWSETATSMCISKVLWDASFIKPNEAPTNGKVTFGVKFSPDGSVVSMAACRYPEGGIPHVELICTKPLHEGLSWIIEFLSDETRAEKTAGIAIDGKNGAGVLYNAISPNYYRQVLMLPGTKGVIDSSVMFEQALSDKQITHTDDCEGSQEALTDSALTSIKRPIGRDGGWSYGGENSTPLEAATLALWANKTTKVDPERKALVW